MRVIRRLLGYSRGANFIRLVLFGKPFHIPFFWRYNAAYQLGWDAGWLAAYKDYGQAEMRRKALEQGIFELVEGDVITISRAQEMLGETSLVPVKERYAAWLMR